MNHIDTPTPSLSEYVEMGDLLKTVKDYYPTSDSLKWLIRHHRRELIAEAALITIAGRLLFHPQRFMRAVVVIGQKTATRRGL